MAEHATIQFRAKRETNVTRWDNSPAGGSVFTDGHTAYRVPKLTAAHVITPRHEWGARHILMFGGSANSATAATRTASLLKNNGLDPYRVYVDDAAALPDIVTITPDRSGFMATITLRVDLAAKPA